MLSIKRNKFFKRMIVTLSLGALSMLSVFIPTISKKIETQNCSLVQVKNDKSPLVEKPILYQFETKEINYLPKTIPLKYGEINWDLPLHVLINSLDSFDGDKYFKDYLKELITKFDCLPHNGRKHTFINVINLINDLENSLNYEVKKSNYQIEYYKESKEKLLEIYHDYAKESNFDDLNVDKMNLSKIKELIVIKFGVNPEELDNFTYEELTEFCQSNSNTIKEIDEVIEFCEAHKTNCESKINFLNHMKEELIDSLYKFVDTWKANNSWYKNYDSTKEMLKEMKKDYENNKKNNFNSLSNDDLYLFSLLFSFFGEEDPIISFSLSNFFGK